MIGALRVKEILDAMEDKYGVSIEGAMRADYVEDLHLVLQKTDQTTIEGGSASTNYNFSNLSGNVNSASTLSSTSLTFDMSGDEVDGDIRFKVTTTATNFTGKLKVNGVTVRTVTTSGTFSSYTDLDIDDVVTFEVETNQTATINLQATLRVEFFEDDQDGGSGGFDTFTITGSVSAVAGGTGAYNVSANLPETKVSDFLADMFKRFNIVAEVEDALSINDYYYAQ